VVLRSRAWAELLYALEAVESGLGVGRVQDDRPAAIEQGGHIGCGLPGAGGADGVGVLQLVVGERAGPGDDGFRGDGKDGGSGGRDFLDEEFIAESAVRAGAGFLEEDTGGVEAVGRRGAEVVKGVDERELPALAVGRGAIAGGPIGVGIPAVGGDEGLAVDADAHSLPVLAASGAGGVENVVMAGGAEVGADD
jgi:hypothetical protein